MKNATATAERISESNAKSVWRVRVGDRAYRATTYPASDLVYLESDPSGRAVPVGTSIKLRPLVREAIATAVASEEAARLEEEGTAESVAPRG